MLREFNFSTREEAEHFLRGQGFRPIRATNWLHADGNSAASIEMRGVAVCITEIRKA